MELIKKQNWVFLLICGQRLNLQDLLPPLVHMQIFKEGTYIFLKLNSFAVNFDLVKISNIVLGGGGT